MKARHVNDVIMELELMSKGEHPKGYNAVSPQAALQLCYVYMRVLIEAGQVISRIIELNMDRDVTMDACHMLQRIDIVSEPYSIEKDTALSPPHMDGICDCCQLPTIKGDCPLNHIGEGETAENVPVKITVERN